MTLPELRERLKYWQERLNLPEWNISVVWGADKDCVGNVIWHAEEFAARIFLKKGRPDVEETLIHELLHVVLQGHEMYEKYDVNMERAINRIAAALQKEQA